MLFRSVATARLVTAGGKKRIATATRFPNIGKMKLDILQENTLFECLPPNTKKRVFLGFAGWVPFWGVLCPSGGSFSGSYKAQKNAQKGRICWGFGNY